MRIFLFIFYFNSLKKRKKEKIEKINKNDLQDYKKPLYKNMRIHIQILIEEKKRRYQMKKIE